jgi:hypothetical protein
MSIQRTSSTASALGLLPHLGPWLVIAPTVILLAVSFAGCGKGPKGPPRVPTFPVKGQLVLDGAPTPGVFLVFHPTGVDAAGGEVIRPRSRTANDGSFQVGTYESADGAPIGTYKVTVQYQPLVEQDGDIKAGPNVVPAQYTRPDTTPLTVEVKEGENTLEEFEVTTNS